MSLRRNVTAGITHGGIFLYHKEHLSVPQRKYIGSFRNMPVREIDTNGRRGDVFHSLHEEKGVEPPLENRTFTQGMNIKRGNNKDRNNVLQNTKFWVKIM